MGGKLKTLAVGVLLVATLSACSQEPETPDACITALDTAEELVTGPVAEQTIESAGIVALVPEAFEAGYNEDVALAEAIISDLDEINVRTEARTEQMETLIEEYNVVAEECRGYSDAQQTAGSN